MFLKHKFRAKPCEDDGMKFASLKERKRYRELKILQEKGEVVCFTRQVPWYLEGGVKYVCDFFVFWQDGTCAIEDVKGLKTPMYIAKKKAVEARYPFVITEV